jgi:hypothetical protein
VRAKLSFIGMIARIAVRGYDNVCNRDAIGVSNMGVLTWQTGPRQEGQL